MGGHGSRSVTIDNVPSTNENSNYGTGLFFESQTLPTKMNPYSNQQFVREDGNKQLNEPFSNPVLGSNSDGINVNIFGMNVDEIDDGIPQLSREEPRSTKSKQVAVAKVSEMSSLLGKAGTAGLGKAVKVLDTLGSSMTSLHLSGGFVSGVTTKGTRISILAFEVANTIVKGASLMQSLSEENITHLKDVVLWSEGVQSLISKDIDELLRIAAADKREELEVFSGEVVRFGNLCIDPQYHNFDRYFEKLASELSPRNQLKEEVETVVQQLMTLVQYTAELYHELHTLDRFEQDYRRKLQEEDNPATAQRGDSLAILRADLKGQRKQVKSLKKKSLWSKIFEEVMEKLVDIVHFLHLEIHEAFGSVDDNRFVKTSSSNHQRLGSAGLALHYANIITQIDTLVTRSSSIPPNMRDSLYHGLPPNVKSALRSKLQTFQLKEELTITQIKVEMEKTLLWLVPIAANTTKAHHGFGWVGEWANTGSDVGGKLAGQDDLVRIETLYHVDKEKVDNLILDLVAWLHHLIIQSTAAANAPVKSPIWSTNQKTVQLSAQTTIIPSTAALPLSYHETSRMLDDEEGDGAHREGLNSVRIGETLSGFTTNNDDDSSSTTTKPVSIVSPNDGCKAITSWEKGQRLGSGSFGTVYEGISSEGFFFALKEVSLQGSQAKQSIDQLEQEISLLSQFEHENIVRYLGTDKDDLNLYIFLELMTQGSLAHLYQKYSLRDSHVSAYTRQILHGLKYLHEKKVVHRDIKCANTLVAANGAVKLADFGLAKATRLNDLKSCKGTVFWMAPEVVNNKNKGYGLAADIWSLGCTVLEMLTGHVPYHPLEFTQALFRIARDEPPPIPDVLSKDARDFIQQCLHVNPNDRPTAAELLEHPFLRRPLDALPGSESSMQFSR